MTLTATDPVVLKRTFPHVDDITDWRAQQTIRLLWDRIYALEERLQAVVATQGDLVSATNRQDDAITLADRKADEALAITQGFAGELRVPGAGGGGGTGGGGGGAVDLVWAWIDRGGNPVVAPAGSVGAPTTIDEWRDYFFGEAGVTLGQPADDFEAVLNILIAAGMRVNAEPGIVPDASWPFFGIHVIVDASGHPRGRIQLPTAVPDGLGYYTHEFQIIADA